MLQILWRTLYSWKRSRRPIYKTPKGSHSTINSYNWHRSITSSRHYYLSICHYICSHPLSICCSNCNQLPIIHRTMPSRRQKIRKYWNSSKQYYRQTIFKTRKTRRTSPRSTNRTRTRHSKKRTRESLCFRWTSLPTTSQICSPQRTPYPSTTTTYTTTSTSCTNGTICSKCTDRLTLRRTAQFFHQRLHQVRNIQMTV